MNINIAEWGTMVRAFAVTWGLRLIGVVATLVAAWLFAKWAGKAVGRGLEGTKLDETLRRFFTKAVRYVVLILAVIMCLGVFGIETASFAAVIAAAGLAIGLAFQGTLSNFAAGVMLLLFRPFKVGDFVSVAGVMGTVKEVAIFFTELATPDNRRVVVPNSKIFGDTIENITHHETRRVEVSVGVDYSAKVDATRKILEQAIERVPEALADPAPQVWLAELGASSVDWKVRAWAKTSDFGTVHQALTEAVKGALDEAGVGIPFPQMDVHLDDRFIRAVAMDKTRGRGFSPRTGTA